MSKSVRLKEYLAAELERIAARENRSLANLVNHLLEQAVEMERRGRGGMQPRLQQISDAITVLPEVQE
jgi:predicted DNA-binding ribbon-helix-helix protein